MVQGGITTQGHVVLQALVIKGEKMNQVIIEENLFKFTYQEISDILISNNFGEKYEQDDIYKMFCGSSYFAIAKMDEQSIGYIRAISDEYLVTFIAEIIVHKDFQGKGVGRKLMQHFNKRYAHTTVWSCVFEENIEFMKKFGISYKKKLFSCTRKWL